MAARANRLVHRLQQRNPRRPRIFRDRTNPLDVYDDVSLYTRFRFPRHELLEIIDEFQGDVTYLATRKGTLPATLQILIAIRFYATGSFQIVVGDLFGVSKSTVHKCIRRVSRAITARLNTCVKFGNQRECDSNKQNFFVMAGFPNVIGCTHVKIIAPVNNEHEYVNRKGYHSINVQLVCDAHLRILNCVVKWPGSVHDARILRESALFEVFRAFDVVPPPLDGCFLGDGGYMLKPWLMTPYINPANRMQRRYNFAHSSTRSTIERCNGVLKRRWHCLHGELRYSPDIACIIISACVVLHNKAIGFGLPPPPLTTSVQMSVIMMTTILMMVIINSNSWYRISMDAWHVTE